LKDFEAKKYLKAHTEHAHKHSVAQTEHSRENISAFVFLPKNVTTFIKNLLFHTFLEPYIFVLLCAFTTRIPFSTKI
jgi:hypothetical protein